jgi:hypothetical protein
MTITCPVNDTVGLCATLDSVGAGMGVLFQYLGASLPSLILILALIGAIVGIFVAVAYVIKGAIHYKTV